MEGKQSKRKFGKMYLWLRMIKKKTNSKIRKKTTHKMENMQKETICYIKTNKRGKKRKLEKQY